MGSFNLKKKKTVPHCVLSEAGSCRFFFLAALKGKEKSSSGVSIKSKKSSPKPFRIKSVFDDSFISL